MKTWKYVPIEELVPHDVLERANQFDLDEYVYTSEVRGQNIRWLAPSKRLLWMATGAEHIEPELLDWIDQIPRGSVYYDLGASNGIFAPDPSNYFLLSWNCYLNHGDDSDISAFNVAASDRFSAGKLYIRKMELGAHEKIVGTPSSVSGQAFAPQYVHAIQLVPFDRWIEQLGLSQPDYIKIDVDGHETPLLDGALNALRACKQVFIEIENAKLDELRTRLGALGFSLTGQHQVQNYDNLWNCIFSR